MDSDEFQELNAVLCFMKGFSERPGPRKGEDLHCLLVNDPSVKEFLRSKWKLSELGNFLRKYPLVFKVSNLGIVNLVDPNVKPGEVDCVQYFFDLLRKRENRPIGVLFASWSIFSDNIQEFLEANYNLQDLTTFFVANRQFFKVDDNLVVINIATRKTPKTKHVAEPVMKPAQLSSQPVQTGNQATGSTSRPASSCSTSSTLSKYEADMENRALCFYVDLLAEKNYIPTSQAHSYLQKKVELRDYLKSKFALKDLTPFFLKYPKKFALQNAHVYLTASAKKDINVMPTGNTGVADSLFMSSASKSSLSTSLAGEQVPNKKTTPVKNIKTIPVPNIKTIPVPNIKTIPVPNIKTIPVPNIKTTPVIVPNIKTTPVIVPNIKTTPFPYNMITPVPTNKPTTVSSEPKNQSSNNVPENKQFEKLLPLLLTSSPKPFSNSNTIVKENSGERSVKFQDVGCQTVSSGPILSLNVFQENEKSS